QETRRKSELVQEARRPCALPRVNELGGRRVRVLGDEAAREPVVEKIRDRRERIGGVDDARRVAARRVELKQRVDLKELDAGDFVDALAADALEDLLHDPLVAEVAVVIRVLEEIAALADERIVDAPSIERDAVESTLARAIERALNVVPQAEDVPAQRAAL